VDGDLVAMKRESVMENSLLCRGLLHEFRKNRIDFFQLAWMRFKVRMTPGKDLKN
jgi:hypothetical protein